jgi:cobyrinic acid a,c-diamide synthase
MFSSFPRITISALRGGAGKTLVSIGLLAAWKELGHQVAPFKKGPDFIDAGWLSFAAGGQCYNLDPFLMNETQILDSFLSHSIGAEASLIEGNRGLFDGLDLEGCCSTAQLARWLNAPVLIVVDATMVTRTVAAIVKGCQVFDPELRLAAVVLNRVAGSRQETLIRQAIERYCDLPVLGAIPKLKMDFLPERHMGLVPHLERDQSRQAVAWARKTVTAHLDLDKIWQIAHQAGGLTATTRSTKMADDAPNPAHGPRIGFIRDRSFWFYYPENLHLLTEMGADLIEVNALSDKTLPELDALYIGGGFPETHCEALADNESFRRSLKEEIQRGLPVYAECGGLMYLGENLWVNEKAYPMVNAVPVNFVLERRPQGHGYTILEVVEPNPYYPPGRTIKGHEFHYSRAVITSESDIRFAFKVLRGHGLDGRRDGLCKNRLLASYTHVHAGGDPEWAKGLFEVAASERLKRKNSRDRELCH